MKGLDISKLQKVSSDENFTTFKHHYGHEVKVAHKKLSGKMREQLDKIPMCKGGKVKMADGGKVPAYLAPNDESKTPDMLDQAVDQPVPQNYSPPQDDSGGAVYGNKYASPPDVPVQDQVKGNPAMDPDIPPPPPEDTNIAQEADDSSKQLNPAPAAPQSQPMPASAPQAAAPAQQPAAPMAAPSMKDDLVNEDQRMARDFQMGYIKPETYQDLFNKKDTLPKIGTLFGLLVSGAGSGLAHQPNAVMAMMNKELENDFNAKQTGKKNALDLYHLQQEKQLQNAQIGQIGAQTKTMTLENQIKKTAFERQFKNRAALQSLIEAAKGTPEGSPQKQALASVATAVNNENYDIAQQAEAQRALMGYAGANSPGNDADSAMQTKVKMLRMQGHADLANDLQSKIVSGVPEVAGQTATRPVPEATQAQVNAMQVLSDKGKDLLNFAQKNKGTINPQSLAVGRQKAEEMMNYYNNSIQGGVLTEGRMKWLDEQIKKNPTSVFQDVLGNNAQLNEIINSNESRKHTLLKNFGFHPQGKAQEAPQQYKTVGGVKYMRGPNGEAVPVK
jgi:hypothetical protein